MTTFFDPLVDRLATVPALVALFVAFLALTALFLALKPRDDSGNEVPALDGRVRYRPSQVYPDYVQRYSADSLRMYAARELTLDMAYPVVYALLGTALLTLLLGGLQAEHPRYYALRWLPFVMAAFDIVENLSIATMLMLYAKGKTVPTLPWIVRIASAGKFLFALLSGLFLLFLLGGLLQRLVKGLFAG